MLYPCQQTNRTKLTLIWTEFATCVLQQNLIKSSWNCGNAETGRADLTATTKTVHAAGNLFGRLDNGRAAWALPNALLDALTVTHSQLSNKELTGAGLQKLDNACAKTQIVKIDCGVLDAIPCQGISGEGYVWQSRRAAPWCWNCIVACWRAVCNNWQLNKLSVVCQIDRGNWTNWVLLLKQISN